MKIESGPFAGLERNGYGAIVSDPPWSFQTYSAKGEGKSPQSKYACMSLDEIKALPVHEIAAPDCALILWAISPMLPHALDVMRAWGFEFKSAGAWAKRTKGDGAWAFGTGFIYRGAVEHYLVGTRGKPKVMCHGIRNLIVSPLREHSRKPDQMAIDAAALWQGPYLEMFARESRPGWTTWGNQAEQFDPPSDGVSAALGRLGAALYDLEFLLRRQVRTGC